MMATQPMWSARILLYVEWISFGLCERFGAKVSAILSRYFSSIIKFGCRAFVNINVFDFGGNWAIRVEI